ncbi:MAG: winged helix-turn-helix domain-containing protein, partial [Lachnospiraceae bacterium]|nr:winged helix-turn-helix domain-containing protein [Lachnospiraceae bacterium]
ADYKKIVGIAEVIDNQGSITPAEAKKVCGKSETSTWRYLNMLTETGYVISEGSTNNTVYKRVSNS